MKNKIKGNTELLQVRSTKAIKLKDKIGRNRLTLNLKEMFGFVPEILVIDKVLGETNKIKVHAVLTDEEIRKERQGVAESQKKSLGRSKKNRRVSSKRK
jgi:hypothetical protein